MHKNEIKDFKLHTGLHTGFYRGVVEDIADPLTSGRVRVRIWGLHSQNTTKDIKDGIPTNELPWAEPCIPIVNGGVQNGLFGTPQINSHVLVIFENGNPLRPIYMGTLPGGNGDWNTGDGEVGKVTILNTNAGYIKLDSTSGAQEIEIKHINGTNILIKDDGNMDMTVTKDCNINVTGDCNINVTGDCNIIATGKTIIEGSQVMIN